MVGFELARELFGKSLDGCPGLAWEASASDFGNAKDWDLSNPYRIEDALDALRPATEVQVEAIALMAAKAFGKSSAAALLAACACGRFEMALESALACSRADPQECLDVAMEAADEFGRDEFSKAAFAGRRGLEASGWRAAWRSEFGVGTIGAIERIWKGSRPMMPSSPERAQESRSVFASDLGPVVLALASLAAPASILEAARLNRPSACLGFARLGADTDERGASGERAVDVAVVKRRSLVFRALLLAGADMSSKAPGARSRPIDSGASLMEGRLGPELTAIWEKAALSAQDPASKNVEVESDGDGGSEGSEGKRRSSSGRCRL